MGRTLKRVPIDFTHPLHTRWQGYLCPYRAEECSLCGGDGYSPRAKELMALWYNFDDRDQAWHRHLTQEDVDALVEGDRLREFTRRPRTEEHVARLKEQEVSGGSGYWLDDIVYRPSAKEVNEWSKEQILAFDAMDQWICVRARCRREGIATSCSACLGTGEHWPTEELRLAYEAWEPTEPPEGPGYQLWETTSEGSPISPVFETMDELCAWAEKNATTFGSARATKKRWRAMLEEDFVYHNEGNVVFL